MKKYFALLALTAIASTAYADAQVNCTLYITSPTGQSLTKKFNIGVIGDTKPLEMQHTIPFGDEVYEFTFYAERESKSVSMYVMGKLKRSRYVIMNGAYASGIDLYGGADHPGFEGKGMVDSHCIVTE